MIIYIVAPLGMDVFSTTGLGETNSTDAATLQSLFFRNLTGQVVFPPGLLFLSSLQLIILLYSSAPESQKEDGKRMGKSNLMLDFQPNWGSLTMFFFLHVFVHTSSQFWPSTPSWAASWARLGIQAWVGAVETISTSNWKIPGNLVLRDTGRR